MFQVPLPPCSPTTVGINAVKLPLPSSQVWTRMTLRNSDVLTSRTSFARPAEQNGADAVKRPSCRNPPGIAGSRKCAASNVSENCVGAAAIAPTEIKVIAAPRVSPAARSAALRLLTRLLGSSDSSSSATDTLPLASGGQLNRMKLHCNARTLASSKASRRPSRRRGGGSCAISSEGSPRLQHFARA